MKIIFDNIIFNLQKTGGISVYWYELVENILDNKMVTSFFVEENDVSKNIFRSKLNVEAKSLIVLNVKYWFKRYRPVDLDIRNSKFIFHSSYYRTLSKKVKNNNNVKEIVTVHDFTYEYFSKGIKRWVHSFQKRKAIREADVVICISENTKKDLLYYFPELIKKDIRVIYNGCSEDYFVIPKLNYDEELKTSFLFVGSRATYKNFNFAVEAVFNNINFKLTIVGSNLIKSEIERLNKFLPGRWEFFNSIDNKKLNELYNSSYALIYPSEYEGFGIPLLEAMNAGCPFIALNKSSIPEVAGNAGVLLDRLTIEDFNNAVLKINKNREEIIKKGFTQAKKFSWQKCYEELLIVYNELI